MSPAPDIEGHLGMESPVLSDGVGIRSCVLLAILTLLLFLISCILPILIQIKIILALNSFESPNVKLF